MAVKIYTTSNCVYCKLAKDWFKKNGTAYEEINVEDNQELQDEIFQKSGQRGVPIIEINGEIVVGFQKDRIAQLMNFE